MLARQNKFEIQWHKQVYSETQIFGQLLSIVFILTQAKHVSDKHKTKCIKIL